MAKPISLDCLPHINGNTAEDFAQAARALFETAGRLQDITARQVTECTHGRNYQHLDAHTARKARERDRIKLEQLIHWVENIQQFALALDQRAQEGR